MKLLEAMTSDIEQWAGATQKDDLNGILMDFLARFSCMEPMCAKQSVFIP